MKRTWFGVVLMLVMSLASLVVNIPVAQASSSGFGCDANTKPCTVLTVQLNAAAPSGTAVKVVREKAMSEDDSFTLDQKSSTTFSSTNGIAFTWQEYQDCRSGMAPANIYFDITVSNGGSVLGKVTHINLCANTQIPNNANGVSKTVSVPITTGGGSLGGMSGTTTWTSGVTSKTGNCQPGDTIDLSGPTNVTIKVGADGTFNSGLTLKPGVYSAALVCHDGDGSTLATNTYRITKTGIAVDAGKITANVHLTSVDASGATPTPSPTPAAPKDDPANDPTCDAGSFTWLLCPLISLATSAIKQMDDVVNEILKTSPLDNGNSLKQIWTVFRDLADALFILLFFVIIFGTSLGLDNYTIKKMLPRLIAAAILVQFSYLLAGVLIDISNVLGQGIWALFGSLDIKTQASDWPPQVSTFGIIQGGVLALGAGVAIIANPALLVPAVLAVSTALIGVIVVFLTLELRAMLIDFLIVIGPIAFLLWVLPNTEKYFKMWREWLVNLLMMFPIIAAMLGVANLFSRVFAADDSTPTVQKIMASIVPILVFFLIPATFKFAGSALALGAGMLGKLGGGLNGGANKGAEKLQEKSQERGLARLDKRTKDGKSLRSFGSKRATRQAGLKAGKSPLQQAKVLKALEANDKVRMTAASHAVKDMDAVALKKHVQDSMKKGDDFGVRAGVDRLAQIGQTGALTELINDGTFGTNGVAGQGIDHRAWKDATGKHFGDLKATAPHLVLGDKAYDTISGAGLAGLDAQGIASWQQRGKDLEAKASAPGASQADIDAFAQYQANARNAVATIDRSTTLPNNIKSNLRDQINGAGYGTIRTAVDRAAGRVGDIGDAWDQAHAENTTRDKEFSDAWNQAHVENARRTKDDQKTLTRVVPDARDPNVSPLDVATAAAEQKRIITPTLEAHAQATGVSVAELERQYFAPDKNNPAEMAFKAQVDHATTHGIPLSQAINPPQPPPPGTPPPGTPPPGNPPPPPKPGPPPTPKPKPGPPPTPKPGPPPPPTPKPGPPPPPPRQPSGGNTTPPPPPPPSRGSAAAPSTSTAAPSASSPAVVGPPPPPPTAGRSVTTSSRLGGVSLPPAPSNPAPSLPTASSLPTAGAPSISIPVNATSGASAPTTSPANQSEVAPDVREFLAAHDLERGNSVGFSVGNYLANAQTRAATEYAMANDTSLDEGTRAVRGLQPTKSRTQRVVDRVRGRGRSKTASGQSQPVTAAIDSTPVKASSSTPPPPSKSQSASAVSSTPARAGRSITISPRLTIRNVNLGIPPEPPVAASPASATSLEDDAIAAYADEMALKGTPVTGGLTELRHRYATDPIFADRIDDARASGKPLDSVINPKPATSPSSQPSIPDMAYVSSTPAPPPVMHQWPTLNTVVADTKAGGEPPSMAAYYGPPPGSPPPGPVDLSELSSAPQPTSAPGTTWQPDPHALEANHDDQPHINQ